MSPIAYKVFQYLQEQPPGANVVMEELILDIRSSKTAVRAAMAELEQLGHLSYTQES